MTDLLPDYLYAIILPLMMVLVGIIGFIAYWLCHQAVKDWWACLHLIDAFFDFVCDKAFGDEYRYDNDGQEG